MKPIEISILILSVVVVLTVQNPLILRNDNPENYYRSGHQLNPSFEVDYTLFKAVGRSTSLISFTTFTLLTRATVTTVLTYTSTTTCTTSTDSLSACPASGCRRRDLEIRPEFLHYENEENRNGRISLSPTPVQNEELFGRPYSNDIEAEIPLAIKPSLLNDSSVKALSFGTSTVKQFVIQTLISILTVVCSSTTGFQTCGSAGK
ncbi:hypothetical protein DAPPUDRAFT_109593 [Daphnia pulex]|uniref:Uncharacterized protein n=1 Tax=Daphnia pulex TaxID=6669 RepID=E9H3K2_DAPPU|nr:hypothetical protein DAPPUDRAFT_109593 [Daphnia pulex]|eukprot:EFX73685.1 hypothetical protein DAPPUDRAFT_109593 [Daphnia pulex]